MERFEKLYIASAYFTMSFSVLLVVALYFLVQRFIDN